MSHVNLSDIDLSQLKVAKSGRMIKIMYNKEPLQLVTGKMYTPFGVKVNTNNYSNFTNCHLDCSLNQGNSETSVKYRESLEALDKRIIELIQESLHLFNTDTNYQPDDIPNIYGPILRENKTYPKLMKITLARDTKGNFDYVIFNENKEKVTITDNNIEEVLCKGKIFKGIIECGKIWYFKGRFGTTWNLKQLKFVENNIVNRPQNSTSESASTAQVYMMLDDD
jgi:hypothetical protein